MTLATVRVVPSGSRTRHYAEQGSTKTLCGKSGGWLAPATNDTGATCAWCIRIARKRRERGSS